MPLTLPVSQPDSSGTFSIAGRLGKGAFVGCLAKPGDAELWVGGEGLGEVDELDRDALFEKELGSVVEYLGPSGIWE